MSAARPVSCTKPWAAVHTQEQDAPQARERTLLVRRMAVTHSPVHGRPVRLRPARATACVLALLRCTAPSVRGPPSIPGVSPGKRSQEGCHHDGKDPKRADVAAGHIIPKQAQGMKGPAESRAGNSLPSFLSNEALEETSVWPLSGRNVSKAHEALSTSTGSQIARVLLRNNGIIPINPRIPVVLEYGFPVQYPTLQQQQLQTQTLCRGTEQVEGNPEGIAEGD